MGLQSDLAQAIGSEWRFKLSAEEEVLWLKEYYRIGPKYAVWGAIFAIIGAPSQMLSELNNHFGDFNTWLFFRLLPSAVIAIALLIFWYRKYSHELLFLIIAYSLFLDFAYWSDCDARDSFLYGQLTMLIPAAIITMLRPFYFVINIGIQFLFITLLYSHYCKAAPSTFYSSKEFIPILIASISCYIVATFRYFLVKRNFVFNIHLQEALNEADEGRKKSDELLKNILPEEIAEELKLRGNSVARGYDIATILFTDFTNFTERSAKMSATELVTEIDESFKGLDMICERYQIEKIKTIGDSYMAAGGLPAPTPDSVRRTVMAALEMQDFIRSRVVKNNAEGRVGFEMRVGIHTGPVVAGIVGVKKFQYDIWGDTVNTASRMESNSDPGKVNISQVTYNLIKDDPAFDFEYRGKIQAKGKGELDMYFVSWRKS
jgi:class 3 adenylate cyclase